MRIALVFNPFKYKVHEENLRIVQKYFGLFPPLSLAWVAAIAEQSGHEVIIIDARTLKMTKEDVLKKIHMFKANVLGFLITTYMFPDTLEWIRWLKSKYDAPIIVGGYNLRIYPKETLTHKEIDFGIVEHAYYTLPALLDEMSKETPRYETVPGLVFRNGEDIMVTAHPQRIVFDDFPMPARHLLPNHLYAEFPTKRRNFTVMVTSLGCPYSCGFCEAGGTEYNPRSPEKVVREIEECYLKYGIREIDFFDYAFTIDKERVKRICHLLIAKKMNLVWACRSRIDSVDYDLLALMKRAGCDRIYFGIESGAPEILKIVNKDIKKKDIQKVVKYCKKLHIATLGFFLIGAPGETRKTVRDTICFAKKLDLDYVQFSKCLAKPLTPLWKEIIETTGKDYWCDWILEKEQDRSLDRPWTVLSNNEIDLLAKKAYISYHIRPVYIIKQVLKLRSWKETTRKFRAFVEMIFCQEKKSCNAPCFVAYNENNLCDYDNNKIYYEKKIPL